MKCYLHWTDVTLDTLNVSVYLHQRLDNLISSDFIPSDEDPEFCSCLSPNLPAGNPLNTLDYSVSEALDRMFPGYDSGSSELLLALVEHVVFFQPSFFFKDSDLIFQRRAPAHISWSMGATRQKWWAVHRGCISIDRRGGKWASDVHCVCGRGYTPFVAEDLEVELDPEDSRPLHYPPEGQRKDEISKDVGMLCSQVAATVKFTKRITDHETFLWGMCDTSFYIVRGYFPASYIEAAHILPGPLPSWAVVWVDRTVFHDMKTVDGRREAVRELWLSGDTWSGDISTTTCQTVNRVSGIDFAVAT